jgi:hypothetical protein
MAMPTADKLFENRSPGNEAEAQAVVDHGEPAVGKLSRADKLARDVIAGNGLPFSAALGGERFAVRSMSTFYRRWMRSLGARIRPSPRSVA